MRGRFIRDASASSIKANTLVIQSGTYARRYQDATADPMCHSSELFNTVFCQWRSGGFGTLSCRQHTLFCSCISMTILYLIHRVCMFKNQNNTQIHSITQQNQSCCVSCMISSTRTAAPTQAISQSIIIQVNFTYSWRVIIVSLRACSVHQRDYIPASQCNFLGSQLRVVS